MRTLILTVLTAMALHGCAKPVEVDPDVPEQAVPLFHMALNDDQMANIYNGAAEELKKRESLQEFTTRLENVRRKMGPVQGTKRQGWKAREDGGSIFVTFTYKTVYAAGEAEEEFVIRMKDGTNTLAGYSIKAKPLTQ